MEAGARASGRRIAAEDGYTMVAAVGAVGLVSVLAAAALAATNGDLNLTQRDLDRKRAHAAAQAGIADYSFHLNNDNGYWARCTEVPEPSAVNQVGSTTKRRPVPGPAGAEYAIELLPANGHASCQPGAQAAPTMLEQSGPNIGSFRIRSTGYAGDAKLSIVATYKRASLLDFIYFTDLETMDPVTYWTDTMVAGAYTQCTKYRREHRESKDIPGTSQNCLEIVFPTGDQVKGPLHTNDNLRICGEPTFGRSPADLIAVSDGEPGWKDGKCSGYGAADPEFLGQFVTTAPVLTPPPTNNKLRDVAGEEYTFTGQTQITLEGEEIAVKVGAGEEVEMPFPAEGVVYVENDSCSASYSPYKPNAELYPPTSGCGNAYVRGDYSGRLTIAAENDIVVDGNIEGSGGGMLGLIANNFVRVYHPVTGTPTAFNQTCNATNGAGSLSNLRIDAAILAINHSFIVDHFNCGANLGNLTVNGAISQKFRGSVGTSSGRGYFKDYNYDDRLRYQEPPNFLDPVKAAWHIQRETLDFPD